MPESIRLFSLCEAMKWAHLPVDGGLYDQHPKFLEQVQIIFVRRAAHEARKRDQEQKKNKPGGSGSIPRKRSKRRR